MKNIDEEGLYMCRFQADVFEISAIEVNCSSGIFLRRFMCSDTAKRMDSQGFQFEPISPEQVIQEVNDKYSESSYGSDKYDAEELYWIGYIYRYWAYTYSKTSKQLYRMIKPSILRQLYYPYHSLDPAEAIIRISEADPSNDEDQIKKGVGILKKLYKIEK